MSNFIDKARDLYFYDQEKYSTTIGKTLKLIGKYSSVKNYLNINLHNIEDLLSIAYMESKITKKSRDIKLVTEFIEVVIENCTGDVKNWAEYFARLVANARFRQGNTSISDARRRYYEQFYDGKMFKKSEFGIVSLNYDLVIENALSRLAAKYGKFYELVDSPNTVAEHFITTNTWSGTGVRIAKLHGSLNRKIVPPTWNKDVYGELRSDWELALKLFERATHIIFLGYSLPLTDNYIKYLLASGLSGNQRLKRISVITKDADGQTNIRYKSLFDGRLTVHNVEISRFFELLASIDSEIDFDEFDDMFFKYYSSRE
jgi:SIR2-like domain